MIVATEILGDFNNPALQSKIHAHEHAGTAEFITLPRADMARRRLRVSTDQHTEVAIALSRASQLFDGAVIYLDRDRSITVRVEPEQWLRVRPSDRRVALALGYFAGNLHWRARFEGEDLLVAVEGDERSYLDRLSHFLEDRRAKIVPTAHSAEEGQG